MVKKMETKTTYSHGVIRRPMPLLVICLLVVIGVCPAMGMTIMPTNFNVNLLVSNPPALFNDYGDNTYNFFNANQGAGQGGNSFHITTDPSNYYGQYTTSTAQSGAFYLSDTGGRSYNDDGILMLAVNGTIPSNFRVHIKSTGPQWAVHGSKPALTAITYGTGIDRDFTSSDFLYGPQLWRPAPSLGNYYPIFHGQDMSDTANTFSIMLIDLHAGNIGNRDPIFASQVTNGGSLKVEYTFENLETFAAFDGYAYAINSNQGTGIRWHNTDSGYYVIGQPSVTPAPEFPTMALPAALIVGMLGAVLCIRRTKEN